MAAKELVTVLKCDDNAPHIATPIHVMRLYMRVYAHALTGETFLKGGSFISQIVYRCTLLFRHGRRTIRRSQCGTH